MEVPPPRACDLAAAPLGPGALRPDTVPKASIVLAVPVAPMISVPVPVPVQELLQERGNLSPRNRKKVILDL